MNLLILGGSHGIGLELAKQALEAGHHVTVLARHPDKMQLHHPHLRVLQGDSSSAEDVEHAMAGQDVTVSTIGIGPSRKPVSVFSQTARNMVLAARKTGRKRLLSVTGIGTGESRGHGGFLYDMLAKPLLLRQVYRDKDREEAILKDSGLDWTIIRPGFLTNGPKTGKYRVITDLEGVKSRKISRSDVADFILRQAESSDYLRKAPLVTY
jgi:putative NADH-flavin reductase